MLVASYARPVIDLVTCPRGKGSQAVISHVRSAWKCLGLRLQDYKGRSIFHGDPKSCTSDSTFTFIAIHLHFVLDMPFFGRNKEQEAPTPLEAENGGVSTPSEKLGEDKIENVDAPRWIGKEEEARLIKKLDRRIVPMMVWMYLMSFMDRGTHTCRRLRRLIGRD